MRVCRERKVLDMLGMARRAGGLLVGQDKVLPALKGAEKFAVFVTDDCSANVSRHIETAVQRGTAEIFLLEGTGRGELGASLGITAAQTAALPMKSGFVKKIYTLTCDRSDANE